MVWEYALGGMRIDVDMIDGRVRGTMDKPNHKLGLPRVCRQIYSEIGTIAYSHNVFSFSDYDAMLQFRTALKQPQWESLRTIRIAVPLAQRMYAPPEQGRIPDMCGGHAVNLGTLYQWRNNPSTPWSSFSKMFDNLGTIVIPRLLERPQDREFLAFVRSKEAAEEVVYS